MRHTTFIAVVLFLSPALTFAQQSSGRQAAPPREQQRDSDSAFIERERAAWKALKDADSAAFVRAVGSSPSLFFVSPNGMRHTSAAEFAGGVTKCDTRSSKLDMFNVVRPNDNTALLIYRATLDRACGTSVDRGVQQMVMTVWVRRNGRWEAIAQSLTPLTVGNTYK